MSENNENKQINTKYMIDSDDNQAVMWLLNLKRVDDIVKNENNESYNPDSKEELAFRLSFAKRQVLIDKLSTFIGLLINDMDQGSVAADIIIKTLRDALLTNVDEWLNRAPLSDIRILDLSIKDVLESLDKEEDDLTFIKVLSCFTNSNSFEGYENLFKIHVLTQHPVYWCEKQEWDIKRRECVDEILKNIKKLGYEKGRSEILEATLILDLADVTLRTYDMRSKYSFCLEITNDIVKNLPEQWLVHVSEALDGKPFSKVECCGKTIGDFQGLDQFEILSRAAKWGKANKTNENSIKYKEHPLNWVLRKLGWKG